MTVTLIVLLVITLLAFIILPFSRDLMKDRAELHENPLEKKFNILISRINQQLMGGHGEITTFKNDPRQVNLFDENHANRIIQFYYSTGTLTITLKYKYFHVELIKKMEFHQMRHAETFRQQDVANHFIEEAALAIQDHQRKVGQQQGLRDQAGNFIFSDLDNDKDSENPVDLTRGMYDDNLNRQEKLALVNIAQIIYTSDGSSIQSFKNHPQLSPLLLNLKVNYKDANNQMQELGETGNIEILKKSDSKLNVLLISVLPFILDIYGPNLNKVDKFYSVFHELGYSQKKVDNELELMMALSKRFGII